MRKPAPNPPRAKYPDTPESRAHQAKCGRVYWNACRRARHQEDWKSGSWPRRKALCPIDAPRFARAHLENAPPSDSTPPARPPSAEGAALRQSKRIVLPGWTAYTPARPHLGRTAAEDDTRIRQRVARRNRALSFSENVMSIVIVMSEPLLRAGRALRGRTGDAFGLGRLFSVVSLRILR